MADLTERVLAQVDALKDEMVDLLCGLVNVPSPPGYEKDACEFISQRLQGYGLPSFVQEVEPTRGNVVATLRGTGRGPTVMLQSHLDTPYTGVEEEDLPLVGRPELVVKPQARVQDGLVFGLGSANDKGPFSAAITAVRALQQSGVRLVGDLTLAGCAGETGRGQIWPFKGPGTRGKSVGVRHLLVNGVWCDYCIVAEPTTFSAWWALPGACYFRVTVRGKASYGPASPRGEWAPAAEPNAILKLSHLLPQLKQWADRWEREHRTPTPEGIVESKVTIGAIDSGLAVKPNYEPGIANAYLTVRMPPGFNPLAVKRDLEQAMAETGLCDEVTMYMSQKGYINQGYEPILAAVDASHHQVFGGPLYPASVAVTSCWNDLNIISELGIPGLKYGPGRAPGQQVESVAIADLVRAAKVYALSALRLCGVSE